MTDGVTPNTFRDLLGRFTTGVTVITTTSPAGVPVGMTANSVTSVSLDPPLLLVCVDRASTMHEAMHHASGFTINVLADDQEELSRQFAGSHVDRFQGIAHRTGANGAPILDDVLSHIECETHAQIEAGDHTIFLGRVTGGSSREGGPLVYYRGAYRTLPAP